MTDKSLYDGKQEKVRDMELPIIETWVNKYPEKEYLITCDTKEFTCVCPKTGLPDFAELFIEYSPKEKCLELKSFKEYLLAYREVGIFHEHVVNRMLEDLVKACEPRKMKIKGIFNTRGGITTQVEAKYNG